MPRYASRWVHQRRSGKDKLIHYHAVWYEEVNGKRRQRRRDFGAGELGKDLANQFVEKYVQEDPLPLWSEFKDKLLEYKEKTVKFDTTMQVVYMLKLVDRIIKPVHVSDIDEAEIDRFVMTLFDEGKSPDYVSVTLRRIRSMFRTAKRWGYYDGPVPEMPPIKVPRRTVYYMTAAEMKQVLGCTHVATRPHQGAEQWWTAFLTFLFMTGWRRKQALSLEWANVDLDNLELIVDHTITKNRMATRLPMHPLVATVLSRVQRTGDLVFNRPRVGGVRFGIDKQFAKIQNRAGVARKGGVKHGTPFSWHDIRRGFATENVTRLHIAELQAFLQHQHPRTTMRYVNIANQLSTDNLVVPQ